MDIRQEYADCLTEKMRNWLEIIQGRATELLNSSDSSARQKEDADKISDLIDRYLFQSFVHRVRVDITRKKELAKANLQHAEELLNLTLYIGFLYARLSDSEAQKQFERIHVEKAIAASSHSAEAKALAFQLNKNSGRR